jgi:hypothetical protein
LTGRAVVGRRFTLTAPSSILTLDVDVGTEGGAVVALGAWNLFGAHSWAVETWLTSKLHIGALWALITSITRSEVSGTLFTEVTLGTLPALFNVGSTSGVTVATSWACNRIVGHTGAVAIVTSRAHILLVVIDTLDIASSTKWALKTIVL